jgi:hypothetical protein
MTKVPDWMKDDDRGPSHGAAQRWAWHPDNPDGIRRERGKPKVSA